MSINRKDFIKKSCLTGLCVCGISAVTQGQSAAGSGTASAAQAENPNALQQAWISALLYGIDNKLTEEEMRNIFKACALTHYNDLGMDNIVKGYAGDVERFIGYLTSEWGWKVEFDKATGRIVCDENKDHCVCPMVNKEKGIASGSICYCSEGFIGKMFSAVAGRHVQAAVESSILRGGKSCRYVVII
jgi:hypothetical protein